MVQCLRVGAQGRVCSGTCRVSRFVFKNFIGLSYLLLILLDSLPSRCECAVQGPECLCCLLAKPGSLSRVQDAKRVLGG